MTVWLCDQTEKAWMKLLTRLPNGEMSSNPMRSKHFEVNVSKKINVSWLASPNL